MNSCNNTSWILPSSLIPTKHAAAMGQYYNAVFLSARGRVGAGAGTGGDGSSADTSAGAGGADASAGGADASAGGADTSAGDGDGDGPSATIVAWMAASDFGFAKLMEHSYIGSPLVLAVEHEIRPGGRYYKGSLVWAGDYADVEPSGKNLYHLRREETRCDVSKLLELENNERLRFVSNHTKKLFVDKAKMLGGHFRIHPLPLLVAEGNGRGGGDYRGSYELLVGSWARDSISVDAEAPAGFTELDFLPGSR